MTKEDIKRQSKEDLKKEEYKDFFDYLGIDPKDFKNLYESIDFDDYSY